MNTPAPDGEQAPIGEPALGASVAPTSGSDSRRVLAALFWLLASVSIMLSSVAVWAHQTLLTSSGWGGIVEDVISDPAVVDDVSAVVVTRIADALDVQDTVAGFLPGSLAIVAGALTNAVEDRIIDGLADFLTTDGFRDAFVAANVIGHEAAMKAIRGGDTEALESSAGLISLNIFPIIEGVLKNLQDAGFIDADRDIPDLSGFEAAPEHVAKLEERLGRDLPDDVGTIVLVESERLETIQQVVRNFDIITVALLLLTLLSIGAALWLSSSRIRMVLWIAGGAIAALAFGRLFARIILEFATDSAAEGDARVTRMAVVDVAVDSLMWFTLVVMAIALVVAIVAVLWERRGSGERRAAQTPPRTLGHAARINAGPLLYVGISAIAVIVIWNAEGPDLALLTAAGLGLLGVAYKVLTAGDNAGAGAAAG